MALGKSRARVLRASVLSVLKRLKVYVPQIISGQVSPFSL